MYTLGYDIGSSSVKASLLEVNTGLCAASAYFPKTEMPISAPKPGWAEQDPVMWWENLKAATRELFTATRISPYEIKALGISYQMHGLVCVNENRQAVRPAIIWCDSRAVDIGAEAFRSIGEEKCLRQLLNSPGNFTASKLKWVKDNEPAVYRSIHKIMLPGDYIAMKLTGELATTITGLSEGVFWDFVNHGPSEDVLNHYGIDKDLLPPIVPVFAEQGRVSREAAQELGLNEGIPVSYRAGDQPNNALSLNVLEPGEIAATAGTSGVVYGVSGLVRFDPESRVNTFAHVNHSNTNTRLGVLLCINGTGILNAWLKKNSSYSASGYNDMNAEAGKIPPGSGELSILPFGNGAERVLQNRSPGCVVSGLDFNRHTAAHMARAAQEGIVFSFRYGMDVMKETGMTPTVIRAGYANMFLSPVFREALATVTGASIELYNTDGSQGAARGAALGAKFYSSAKEAFGGLRQLLTTEPDPALRDAYSEAYDRWLQLLQRSISTSHTF